MRKRFFAIAALSAAVLFIVLMSRPVDAQGPQQPQIQPSYTLDKQYDGNLTFIGGEFELTKDGEVDGNVTIAVTQIANVHGVIHGNLTISAPLGGVDVSDMHVEGNVSICARYLNGEDSAQINGNFDHSNTCNYDAVLQGNSVEGKAATLVKTWQDNPFWHFVQVLLTSIVIAAFAALAFMIFPTNMDRLVTTALGSMKQSATVGFLSMGVVSVAVGVYTLSLILTLGLMCLALPFVGLGVFGVVIALILGWITVAAPLGDLVLRRFKIDTTPMVTAVFGTFILTFAQGFLQIIPCLGWLSIILTVILGSIGLGAVILTRAGTRAYPEFISAKPKNDLV